MSNTVLVVGGTCGTGKTTIGEAIADNFSSKFIEGDSVHPKENIEKMSNGIPLQDEDRWGWLQQISKLSTEAASKDSHHFSIISCSALKKKYRDLIAETSPTTNFLYLYLFTTKEELIKRTELRKGHYMKSEMVDSQFRDLELPDPIIEPNTLIVDVSHKSVEEITKIGIEFVESHK